jgi:hypothetical protein
LFHHPPYPTETLVFMKKILLSSAFLALLIGQASAANQTPVITPAANQTVTYSTTPQTVTLTPTSTSPAPFSYTFTSKPPTGTTINATTGAVTIGSPGTISVSACQAGTTGWNAAPWTAIGTITVLPGTPTITPAANQTVTYAASGVQVTVQPTSTSSGAFTYSLAAGAPAGASVNVNNGQVLINGAGSCTGTVTVMATQAASANYAAVTTPFQVATITVNPATPTITPALNQTVTYTSGMAPVALNGAPKSTSPGAFTYSLGVGAPSGTSVNPTTGAVTVGSMAGATTAATITVQVTQAVDANNNYTAVTTPVTVSTITVNPAPITPVITPAANQTVTYSSTPQTVTLTPTSTSPGAFTYGLSGATTGTSINPVTGAVTIGGAGTITVYVTQAASGFYTSAGATTIGTITVNKANPVLTGATSVSSVWSPTLPPQQIQPTSTSSGAFTYTISGGPAGLGINQYNGQITFGNAIGTVSVYVTQAATANYNAVTTPFFVGTVSVTGGATQSINPPFNASNFSFPAAHVVGTSATLTTLPTTTSGLPVTIIVTGPAIYNPTTQTITPTGAGNVTVTATQPGTVQYAAATPLSYSFAVLTGSGGFYFSPQ